MRNFVLLLWVAIAWLCLPGTASSQTAATGCQPFKGVWEAFEDETDYRIALDLYGKSIRVEGEANLTYGYYFYSNDFSEDYFVITKVKTLDAHKAVVEGYSQKYGDPGKTEEQTFTSLQGGEHMRYGDGATLNRLKYLEVTGKKVNIRQSPKTGAVLMQAVRGMVFPLLAWDGSWHKVKLADGREGYVSADYTKAVEKNGIPEGFFKGSGQFLVKGGHCNLSFCEKGGYVFMQVDTSVADTGAGTSMHEGTYIYCGRAEGNQVTFTRRSWFSPPFIPDMEGIGVDELEECEPYVVYYSPSADTLIIDGSEVVLQVY